MIQPTIGYVLPGHDEVEILDESPFERGDIIKCSVVRGEIYIFIALAKYSTGKVCIWHWSTEDHRCHSWLYYDEEWTKV